MYAARVALLPLLVVAMSGGCRHGGSEASTSAAVGACPGEAALERLHRAAFWLEQGGRDSEVHADLAALRGFAAEGSATGAGSGWVAELAARMEAVVALESGRRRYEAEVIRADLHASACLTEAAHRRFHRSLPALPAQAEGTG